MKCIKRLTSKKDGKIIRTTNEQADIYVNAGIAEYVSKKEWKKAGRKYQ